LEGLDDKIVATRAQEAQKDAVLGEGKGKEVDEELLIKGREKVQVKAKEPKDT